MKATSLIPGDGVKSADQVGKATEAEGKPSGPLIAVLIVIFVASGVAQPLLSSQNKYMGLGNAEAQLYMVPYFIGMASVGFLYFCVPSRRWFQYKVYKSCGIALVDLSGQVLNYTGNNMAGSGIFAVIYASVSIWCAVLSWVFGLRKLHILQWLTILLVFGGLVVSAVGSVEGGSQVAIGAGLLVVGAFLHAVMYCLSEFVSTRGGEDEKIPPHINCSTMATVEASILTIWQFVYTVPHWDEAIEQPAKEQGTTTAGIVIIFAALGFANFVHSASFFYLLKHLGAVSAAVMKGLQAVLVFLMADLIFCPAHVHQCLDGYKWTSLVIVVGGVLAYAVVTTRLAAAAARDVLQAST